MALTERIPLMEPGNTRRNALVVVALLVLLPFVFVVLPFYLLVAVGTNRNDLADRLADSPLGRLPGVSAGGWTAGIAVFGYTMLLLVFLSAALGGGGESAPDDPAVDPTVEDDEGAAAADVGDSDGEDAADDTATEDTDSDEGDAGDGADGDDADPPDDTDGDSDNGDEADTADSESDDTEAGSDDQADGGDEGQETAGGEEESVDEENTDGGDGDSGITQVTSDTYGVSGLGTGVSHSGDTVLFGFDDGNLMVYDENRDGAVTSLGPDSAVTHIQIPEGANTATVAWMDAGLYGVLDLTEVDGPVVQHPGLWDVAPAADGTTVASVSSPAEGTGSVGLSTDGDVEWETDLGDATGMSVAVTDDGGTIAVGAAHYWSGTERHGTPGVRLFDADGTERWTHETVEDVLSIDVDADRELVVAGTDDGKTLVLNFDGEVIWETDEYGGWVVLSDDGSTLVTSEPGSLYAVDAETGDERWTADIGFWASQTLSVSADGSRVLAADQAAGEVRVVEEGEVIWAESYDVGPANGAISGDGTTWSIIVQNNDDQSAHVEIYRDG